MIKSVLKGRTSFTERSRLLIFVLLIIFTILLMPNGYCLDFSVNGLTYEVEDLETLRDYMYFSRVNDNSLPTSIVCANPTTGSTISYGCIGFNDYQVAYMQANANISFGQNAFTNYTCISTYDYETFNDSCTTFWLSFADGYFSNTTFEYAPSWGQSASLVANYTYQDIIEKYPVQEEPLPEPNPPSGNYDTYFQEIRKDIYIGLLMFGTLIFMLFFKWCFPMKGGKKL